MAPPKISSPGILVLIATTEGLISAITGAKSGITGIVRLIEVGGRIKEGSIGEGITVGVGVGLVPSLI